MAVAGGGGVVPGVEVGGVDAEVGEGEFELGAVFDTVGEGVDEEEAGGETVAEALVGKVGFLFGVEVLGDVDELAVGAVEEVKERLHAGPGAVALKLAFVLPTFGA